MLIDRSVGETGNRSLSTFTLISKCISASHLFSALHGCFLCTPLLPHNVLLHPCENACCRETVDGGIISFYTAHMLTLWDATCFHSCAAPFFKSESVSETLLALLAFTRQLQHHMMLGVNAALIIIDKAHMKRKWWNKSSERAVCMPSAPFC